jgi:hypothetical protein
LTTNNTNTKTNMGSLRPNVLLVGAFVAVWTGLVIVNADGTPEQEFLEGSAVLHGERLVGFEGTANALKKMLAGLKGMQQRDYRPRDDSWLPHDLEEARLDVESMVELGQPKKFTCYYVIAEVERLEKKYVPRANTNWGDYLSQLRPIFYDKCREWRDPNASPELAQMNTAWLMHAVFGCGREVAMAEIYELIHRSFENLKDPFIVNNLDSIQDLEKIVGVCQPTKIGCSYVFDVIDKLSKKYYNNYQTPNVGVLLYRCSKSSKEFCDGKPKVTDTFPLKFRDSGESSADKRDSGRGKTKGFHLWRRGGQ